MVVRLRISQKVLLAMLGVTVVSLGIFSFLMITSTGRVLQQNISRQIQALAESSVQNLVDLVSRSQGTLRSIATSPDLSDFLAAEAGGDHRVIVKTLRRLETTFLEFEHLDPTLQAIRLVDTSGREVVKIREGRILPHAGAFIPTLGLSSIDSIDDHDFFHNTKELKKGEIGISNLEHGWIDGADFWCPAMVRFSMPLFFPDGRRAGAVIINVWGATVGTKINSLLTPEQGQAFLIERNRHDPARNGIYLFSQKPGCEFGNQTGTKINVFKDYPPAVTRLWMSEDKGVTVDPESNDLLAHVFYSPYHDRSRGWVVVVKAHKSYFMHPLLAIKKRILFSTGLMLALSALVACFFSRSITRPIRAVIDGTHRIVGDLSSRIPLRSHDEIGLLAGEINRMAATLQENLEEKKRVEEKIHNSEKLASIGEMAAGLAHELNTPLSNIRALSSLTRQDLANGALDPETLRRDLGDIIEQIDKSSQIISGLLSFARKQASEFVLCDVNELIERSLALIRIKREKQGVEVAFARNDRLPFIKADQHQIQQVFVNILLNALAAVDGVGQVTVAADFRAGKVEVCFRDNGCGIAPEHLRRIFDPFFTTKEVGKGTGLGLSVSYGIVKNHGGTIEVDSAPAAGTTFTVSLPLGEV